MLVDRENTTFTKEEYVPFTPTIGMHFWYEERAFHVHEVVWSPKEEQFTLACCTVHFNRVRGYKKGLAFMEGVGFTAVHKEQMN